MLGARASMRGLRGLLCRCWVKGSASVRRPGKLYQPEQLCISRSCPAPASSVCDRCGDVRSRLHPSEERHRARRPFLNSAPPALVLRQFGRDGDSGAASCGAPATNGARTERPPQANDVSRTALFSSWGSSGYDSFTIHSSSDASQL